MLSFNTILRASDIEPRDVKLLRHVGHGEYPRLAPFNAWHDAPEKLLEHCRIQRRPEVYGKRRYTAHFVAAPANETLFVGLREVRGCKILPVGSGVVEPFTGKPLAGERHYYGLSEDLLPQYSGRLLVEWGESTRAWSQNAERQDKPIVALLPALYEVPFPGFGAFSCSVSQVLTLPATWRNTLTSVGGVYLLVDPSTGEQYVGSAYGEGGFIGRWDAYVRNGHGGNKLLKDRPRADYQISILEVSSATDTPEDVIRREALWKEKLGSRAHGLNAN